VSLDLTDLDLVATRLGLDDAARDRLRLASISSVVLGGNDPVPAVDVIALAEYVATGYVPAEARGTTPPEEAVEAPPAHVWETPGTAFGPSTRRPDGPIR
jgi:hypothetical protein